MVDLPESLDIEHQNAHRPRSPGERLQVTLGHPPAAQQGQAVDVGPLAGLFQALPERRELKLEITGRFLALAAHLLHRVAELRHFAAQPAAQLRDILHPCQSFEAVGHFGQAGAVALAVTPEAADRDSHRGYHVLHGDIDFLQHRFVAAADLFDLLHRGLARLIDGFDRGRAAQGSRDALQALPAMLGEHGIGGQHGLVQNRDHVLESLQQGIKPRRDLLRLIHVPANRNQDGLRHAGIWPAAGTQVSHAQPRDPNVVSSVRFASCSSEIPARESVSLRPRAQDGEPLSRFLGGGISRQIRPLPHYGV